MTENAFNKIAAGLQEAARGEGVSRHASDPLSLIREDEKMDVTSTLEKDGSRRILAKRHDGTVSTDADVYLKHGSVFIVTDRYEGAAVLDPEAIPLLVEALQALVPPKPKTIPLGEIGPEAF